MPGLFQRSHCPFFPRRVRRIHPLLCLRSQTVSSSMPHRSRCRPIVVRLMPLTIVSRNLSYPSLRPVNPESKNFSTECQRLPNSCPTDRRYTATKREMDHRLATRNIANLGTIAAIVAIRKKPSIKKLAMDVRPHSRHEREGIPSRFRSDVEFSQHHV